MKTYCKFALFMCTVAIIVAFGTLAYLAFDETENKYEISQPQITIERLIVVEPYRQSDTLEAFETTEQVEIQQEEETELEHELEDEIEHTHSEDVITNWWEVDGAVPDNPDIPDEIERWAIHYGREYSICPELIMAICWKESRFKPEVTNGQYYGLMQVGINTHKHRIKKLGYTTQQMLEIEPNIHTGCDYLAELFEEYEDPADVLCAYGGFASYIGTGEIPEYVQAVLDLSAEYEEANGK